MDSVRLTGERVTVRPVASEDRDRLREILAEPSVARWWGPADVDQATDELYDATFQTTFVIEVDGDVIGSIQCAEEEDPVYRHAGIDLFVETAHQGQGFGPDAIRTIARFLFEVRGHHRLTIDPAASNERAIRAYGRVGFRPVGIMRAYERGPDGTFHDGLMMDLLAGELSGS